MQIHTPDSSRYWLAGSYEERHRGGQEPQNIDKEFLRLWFRDHCDPYRDEVLRLRFLLLRVHSSPQVEGAQRFTVVPRSRNIWQGTWLQAW